MLGEATESKNESKLQQTWLREPKTASRARSGAAAFGVKMTRPRPSVWATEVSWEQTRRSRGVPRVEVRRRVKRSAAELVSGRRESCAIDVSHPDSVSDQFSASASGSCRERRRRLQMRCYVRANSAWREIQSSCRNAHPGRQPVGGGSGRVFATGDSIGQR